MTKTALMLVNFTASRFSFGEEEDSIAAVSWRTINPDAPKPGQKQLILACPMSNSSSVNLVASTVVSIKPLSKII